MGGLGGLRRLASRTLRWLGLRPVETSAGYTVLAAAPAGPIDGWLASEVAERQHQAYRPLLAAMHAGAPRLDLSVAAQAVALTGLADPALLEVGCGSGYYAEILPHLLGAPVAYVGLDYSPAMVALAERLYPERKFVVGDATALPFEDGTFDIVLNGVSLMHIRDYPRAITESRRVSRGWVILHTVPLVEGRPTTFLQKLAYGKPTLEIVFNEAELRALLAREGLAIVQAIPSLPYDLGDVLGVPSYTKTFVCRKAAP